MRENRLQFLVATIALASCLVSASAQEPVPRAQARTRAEFAAAMAQVKEGMSRSEVLRLLGPPDDIRTREDFGKAWYSGDFEYWCYGAAFRLAFPTLGTIEMRPDRVGYVRPALSSPPDPAVVSEAELRSLLPMLDTAPAVLGKVFDPLKLIRIVNTLQPLGKEKALAVIGEFLRVAPSFSRDSREGMFLVMRTLFEVPADPGYQPELPLGGTFPRPLNLRLAPQFPLVIQDDVPLLQVGQYVIMGMPGHPEDHLEHFRKSGIWRSKRLKPTDNPLAILERLKRSRQWAYSHPNAMGMTQGSKVAVTREQRLRGRQMAMGQLARLVSTAYRLPTVDGRSALTRGCDDAKKERTWQHLVAAVQKLKMRWNAEQNCYVRSPITK